MKFIACLIYWPLRILWLLFCAFTVTFIIWAASVWCWEHAGTHKWEIAICASLVIAGGLIIASYEWAKRTLKK